MCLCGSARERPSNCRSLIMERWCPLIVKLPREWVLWPDCFPTLVGRRPLGRVGQEMGCRQLWLQKDSRKVDIWFSKLGLQWNVLAFKGKTRIRSNPKEFRRLRKEKKIGFCQRLLRRAAESCVGQQGDRREAVPGRHRTAPGGSKGSMNFFERGT
ncbi:hypothetical protein Tco_1062664 [Tanacetum coccineum]